MRYKIAGKSTVFYAFHSLQVAKIATKIEQKCLQKYMKNKSILIFSASLKNFYVTKIK